MNQTNLNLGRAVFLSAERAALDDFSQVSAEHVDAAVAYGKQQLILTPRSRKVLRLLMAERAGRNETTGR